MVVFGGRLKAVLESLPSAVEGEAALLAHRLLLRLLDPLHCGPQSGNLEDRARLLRTEIDNAGFNSAQPTLELAVCFHHAVLGAHGELAAETAWLREMIQGGDYAYYVDIAQFMADIPLPIEPASQARWLDGEQPTRPSQPSERESIIRRGSLRRSPAT
ncbi:hypothetical protein QFZ67_000052 [Streptomyces sp. V1I1]|nr:hypothetical protein [Streptomyces sp. V1I1]